MQTETGALEFRNPKLERTVALTSADRKWMDDILTDVNETWNESDSQPTGLHQCVTLPIDIGPSFTPKPRRFKGSKRMVYARW